MKEFTTYESENSKIDTDKLQSIFFTQLNLGDYNIRNMVLVLENMIENFELLFDDQNLIEKPLNSVAKAIENPPAFFDMVPGPIFYTNKVIFPK